MPGTFESTDVLGEIVSPNSVTIAPKHLNLGIRSDEEFSKLMSEVVISQGGQLPNINEFFQKKKKGGAAASASQPV